MEALNLLTGILFLTVVYAVIDNYNNRLRIKLQEIALKDMWVALSALKEHVVNNVATLTIQDENNDLAVDALVDALERFDQRIAKLEPLVEEPMEDEL